ncbi:MAG: hypothetical protein U0Q11_12970 [Vicinamibacterales bacterium]
MTRRFADRIALITLLLIVAATPWAQAPLIGRLSFPTSESGRAQDAFERGVLYLHNFEYDDAIIAFRDAQRLSPGFAMAYWGEALCQWQPLWFNENVPHAREILNRLAPTAAARLAKAGTPREKAYLTAIEQLFGSGSRESRAQHFAEALAAIARDYPADDEAQAFESLALLASIPQNTRRPDISLKAGAIASAVLKRNSQHPGAAHYMLHAYDDGEHAAMALPAARSYASIAPQSSHAQHAVACLPAAGYVGGSREVRPGVVGIVVNWVRKSGRTINQQDFHSLSWLHFEYLQQGRFSKAREVATMVQRALDDTVKLGPAAAMAGPGHGAMASEIGRGYDAIGLRNELANMRARSIIEGADWHLMKGSSGFGNVDELATLGLSAVANDDNARAEAVLTELRKAVTTAPDKDAADVTGIMIDEVSATLAIAQGRQGEALSTLSRAAAREYARPKPIARPYPAKPAGELYAEALSGLGQPQQAVTEFRKVLQRLPRRPMALLGLARASKAAGNNAEAQRAANEFLGLWRLADNNRPELAEARALANRR